jgi:hypothetical protein
MPNWCERLEKVIDELIAVVRNQGEVEFHDAFRQAQRAERAGSLRPLPGILRQRRYILRRACDEGIEMQKRMTNQTFCHCEILTDGQKIYPRDARGLRLTPCQDRPAH